MTPASSRRDRQQAPLAVRSKREASANVIGSKVREVIYDKSVGSCVHDGSTRQVVRVESAALTLEVKSILKKEGADETERKLHGRLLQMQRYYRARAVDVA
jgi:hypothetical protein